MFGTLKSLCMVTLLITIGLLAIAQAEQTPVYVWTSTIKGNQKEDKNEISSKAVTEEIKKILDNTDANSLIVYFRPGMTTESFYNVLTQNNKIANQLKKANPRTIERSYTNVIGVSIVDTLRAEYNDAKLFTITNQESLNTLKSEIENAPVPFINKIYLVELLFEKDAIFDDVVSQVEKLFASRTLNNHVSVLAGSSSTPRFLQETDVEPTTEDAVNDDPTLNYLTSIILLKNLISIPLILLLIVGLLQMYNIKTPKLFVEKGIDFGKIEK